MIGPTTGLFRRANPWSEAPVAARRETRNPGATGDRAPGLSSTRRYSMIGKSLPDPGWKSASWKDHAQSNATATAL